MGLQRKGHAVKDPGVVEAAVRRHVESGMGAKVPSAASRDGLRDLSSEQPLTPMPPSVTQVASDKMAAGETHYADIAGIQPLKECVCSFLRRLDVEATSDQVLITAGEQETRFLCITSQSFHGDARKIALPAVVHPGAGDAAGYRRLEEIEIQVDGDLQPTLDGINRALDEGADILYLESPNRLTGRVLDEGFTRSVLEAADASGATVVWDQGLAPWVHGQAYRGALSYGITDSVRAMGAATVAVGMESWPLGYIVSSTDVLNGQVRLLKQIICICTSTVSQWGAVEAHRYIDGRLDDIRESLHLRRAEAADLLSDGAGIEILSSPTSSHLALKFADEREFARAKSVLDEKGYRYTDGENYGATRVMRLTTTTSFEGIVRAAEILRKDRGRARR